jgi:hypothetical protein
MAAIFKPAPIKNYISDKMKIHETGMQLEGIVIA